MHELGHNLGLRHGGDDHTNYKPSYLSIMNYSFQFGGLRLSDGSRRFDYSTVGVPLDENALDEATGFGFAPGSAPAQYETLVRCPNDPAATLFVERLVAGPVDWDCDGVTQGQVAADLNGDGALTAFGPFVDWPAIVYDGGAIGALGASASLPQTTEMIEPQLDELLENERALATGAGSPPPGPSAADTTAPSFVGSPKAKPARFAVDGKGAREKAVKSAKRKVKRGTTFRYALSEAARVLFTIERKNTGKKVGKRCRKERRSNRAKKPAHGTCALRVSPTRQRPARTPSASPAGSGASGSRPAPIAQGSPARTPPATPARPRSSRFRVVKP